MRRGIVDTSCSAWRCLPFARARPGGSCSQRLLCLPHLVDKLSTFKWLEVMASMGNLRRIFYVSRADAGLDGAAVKDIVLRSQRANRQRDVTGVLAHSGKYFAQVLEGTEDNLAAVTAKIKHDRRHTAVTVLSDEPILKRDYAEWSMGFLYDARLSDEIEKVFMSGAVGEAHAQDGGLARRIFLHVSDLARP